MLGLNLAACNGYNSEIPFADLMKQSAPWTSSLPGKWAQGQPLITANDYPVYIVPVAEADSGVIALTTGIYPAGDYTIRWEGAGHLDLWPASGPTVVDSPGRRVQTLDPTKQASVILRILDSSPVDPVRNVRVYLPGQELAPSVWNPTFLARWKGVKCLRYMDLMGTNNSTQAAWADRPVPTQRTWADARGVPVEMLCDLANRTGVDPWFCVPHLADDTWLAGFVKTILSYLSPARTPYIEWSNEVWNGAFAQARYANAQAAAAGITTAQWCASQAVRCFKVLEAGLVTRPMVRVLSGQLAGLQFLQGGLAYQDTAAHVDAIAVAYYMESYVTPATTAAFVTQTPAQVVGTLRATLPVLAARLAAHQALATQYGKRLVGYEGGASTRGVLGAENTQAVNDLFYAAHASPEMGQLYLDWYAGWKANTSGDLLNHFNGLSLWSKWGSWGLSRHPYEVTPKHAAFLSMLNA